MIQNSRGWSASWMRDMLFVLRSVFWLGLAFSAIEWPANQPVFPSAEDLAAQATAQAARLCIENPRACMEAAKTVQSARKAAEPEAKPVKRGVDTLGGADRAPAWRGRG